MKKCNNPYCECEQTFSDDTKLCPFCGSELTPVENTAHSRMHTADELLDFPASPPALPLVTAGVLGHTVVRGSVLEIDHSSLFYSGFHKWCNAIFCGEPWQFAHQSQAYTLRLEEISPDNIPGRVIDICAFGDFLGRFSIGDELEVHCTGTVYSVIQFNCSFGGHLARSNWHQARNLRRNRFFGVWGCCYSAGAGVATASSVWRQHPGFNWNCHYHTFVPTPQKIIE